MPETTAVGNVSEAKILVALIEAGYTVSKPFGEGCKYDFVVDDGKSLQRVQCKTGRLRNGCVVFNAYSIAGNSNGKRQGYIGCADLFAVYCSDTGQTYLVPVADVGVGGVLLRVEKTLNNQYRRVRWARTYELMPLSVVQDMRV
ncbi:MAG TPA: group I intron-associated PD-(D/E)XK endonuclease [Chloroflexia bacterium]|nr:group I intron-associated PD-(D/E)XK endonuclease [Chloroflexia bacterium]